ncbi:MAG: hypothetical protein H7A23_12065 [Leptospiraceae bacterium]|nr:hypothetical protein [Leptospiraceae bacterium]
MNDCILITKDKSDYIDQNIEELKNSTSISRKQFIFGASIIAFSLYNQKCFTTNEKQNEDEFIKVVKNPNTSSETLLRIANSDGVSYSLMKKLLDNNKTPVERITNNINELESIAEFTDNINYIKRLVKHKSTNVRLALVKNKHTPKPILKQLMEDTTYPLVSEKAKVAIHCRETCTDSCTDSCTGGCTGGCTTFTGSGLCKKSCISCISCIVCKYCTSCTSGCTISCTSYCTGGCTSTCIGRLRY